MPLIGTQGPYEQANFGALFLGGFQAGSQAWNQAQARKRLEELDKRQATLQGVQTLGSLLELPKNIRGPLLDKFGEQFGAAFGTTIDPTFLDVLKKADEEQSQTLREMFTKAGLEMDPTDLMNLTKDPLKAMEFGLKFLESKRLAASDKAFQETFGGQGPAPATTPPPAPPDPRRAFFEGLPGQPGARGLVGDIQGPPVVEPPLLPEPPAPPSPIDALRAERTRLEGLLGRVQREGQRSAIGKRIERIDKDLEALTKPPTDDRNAIALELEKIATPRPMTHDLIKNILESIEAQVVKVVVTDLKENTFFAVLHLRLGTAEYTVDSRPSDAIALALRVAAPIYVDEEVFPKAGKMEIAREAETVKTDDPEQLREWLQNIKPEDFEKFNKA